MLSNLRRISTLSQKSTSNRDSGYGSAPSSASSSPLQKESYDCSYFRSTSASLLGLPAELRHQIFFYVAASTTLSLSNVRKPVGSKKFHGPEPHGLLLANRQTRREFQDQLLSVACVEIRVQNYDFANLIRVLASQTDAERYALVRNANLWITLSVSHVPTREYAAALRHWYDFRAAQSISGRSTPASTRRASRATCVVEEDEDEDEDEFPIAPLRSDVYPLHPQFHYCVRFTSQIRPPRPAIRYSCREAMKLDLLQSQIKMVEKVKVEAGTVDHNDRVKRRKRGELERIAEDLSRQAACLGRLLK